MTHETPKLYLDHSAISHEGWWPQIDALLAPRDLQLVLSVWNLIEIGSATDRAQQDRRLAFLDQYKPLWVMDRIIAQRKEVERFLWKSRFGLPLRDLGVVAPHLSMVAYHFFKEQTLVGITPRGFIDTISFDRVSRLKDLSPDALRELQALDRKTFKARQRRAFARWIENRLPKDSPDGKPFSLGQRAELLAWCEANRDAFFGACPSVAVENALTTARTSTANRNPQRSDGIDMMHAAVALPYCDYFLLRDGFAQVCAEQAKKALSHHRLASVYDDPARLRADLMQQQAGSPGSP